MGRLDSVSITSHGQNPRFAEDKIQLLPSYGVKTCKNYLVDLYNK